MGKEFGGRPGHPLRDREVADVDEELDRMTFEEREEFIEGSRRMANREDLERGRGENRSLSSGGETARLRTYRRYSEQEPQVYDFDEYVRRRLEEA